MRWRLSVLLETLLTMNSIMCFKRHNYCEQWIENELPRKKTGLE